jgi:hypothetical protein
MNTINKLLARLGYKLTRTDEVANQSDLQLAYASLEAQVDDLKAQKKELTRKLACKTAGEWYWRKQARKARGG